MCKAAIRLAYAYPKQEAWEDLTCHLDDEYGTLYKYGVRKRAYEVWYRIMETFTDDEINQALLEIKKEPFADEFDPSKMKEDLAEAKADAK
jgi:hypothetical protein